MKTEMFILRSNMNKLDPESIEEFFTLNWDSRTECMKCSLIILTFFVPAFNYCSAKERYHTLF